MVFSPDLHLRDSSVTPKTNDRFRVPVTVWTPLDPEFVTTERLSLCVNVTR
jgi:hypothetical protein